MNNKVLVVGDLHISDSYVGSHQDYWVSVYQFLVVYHQ